MLIFCVVVLITIQLKIIGSNRVGGRMLVADGEANA